MKNLAITLLAIVIASGLPNANAQQRTPVEKSALQAREVLEAGIKAMGGVDELQKIADITREMSGTRSEEGQGMMPVWPRVAEPPVLAQPKLKSVRDIRGGRAYDEVESVIFGGQPLHFRSAVAGANAFGVSETAKEVRPLPPPAVPNARAARFRRYPESLLMTAFNRPEALRWIGEGEFAGRKQRVLSFADADGTEVSLYFDATNNLLTKAEFLNDDPVLGDVAIETVYADWKPFEKLVLPFRYIDRVGGSVVQDMRVTSVAINTHPPGGLFAMPDSYAKVEPAPPVPIAKKLSEDVYALTGPYNSMFVVFNDYVLVVEAGANNRYSAASIAEIKKIARDKPIRYLVSTHFHFDHLSGVRSYIAEGTTIITTPTAKSVIERIANTSHVMRPDALSRNPKKPVIETIGDKRVFEDGMHQVELYRFASPHAGEMIVAYLPKQKILFEADMLDISDAGRAVAGDDTVDLAKQIERLGLEVETIIPVHGRIGTLADLTGAVTERVSKRE